MRQLTGAIPSTHDPTDSDFHRSELYAGALPPAVRDYDFRHIHRWRIQGSLQCVQYSLCAKVQSLAAAQGKPLEDLSAEFNWWVARDLAAPPGTAITGSSCRLGHQGARDIGLKAERVFPDRPENHGRVPPAKAQQAPPLVKVKSAHRIKGEADPKKLRDGLLTAFSLLEAGGQCSFAGAVLEVGSGFAGGPEGQAWDGNVGDPWGNHDEAVITYRQVDDCFGLASSWPKRPGDTEESENAIGEDGGRIFWIPTPILAAKGFEFWIVDQLEYL